jgi:hypothetical protein
MMRLRMTNLCVAVAAVCLALAIGTTEGTANIKADRLGSVFGGGNCINPNYPCQVECAEVPGSNPWGCSECRGSSTYGRCVTGTGNCVSTYDDGNPVYCWTKYWGLFAGDVCNCSNASVNGCYKIPNSVTGDQCGQG